MHWFESNLQTVLIEAGPQGLRINDIVRNVCNMEPQLFAPQRPYEKSYGEIYRFLRCQSEKKNSPYKYVTDKRTGGNKWGRFMYDPSKQPKEEKDTKNAEKIAYQTMLDF